MSQTSVGTPAVGLAGMIASTHTGTDVQNFALKTAAIDAGLYVTDAGSGQCERPDAAAEITGIGAYGGFTVLRTGRDPSNAQYQVTESVPVLRLGEMYVTCENAATKGNQVYIRYASGAGGTTLGAVRDGSVASETAALPRWYFAETTSGAGLVLIRGEAIS